ncbi:permease-like cell division protein FtsX [Nocardioides insulae]|uniref:permease-like cell division protein FtsX n=1 Tax=Nocardioides insulae TaxID=394734 RepID=UPI0004276B32|nr:permease-like cell division protein FtsX [Nocardioides insulae]
MQLRYVFTELGQSLRRNVSMHLAVILTLFVSLTLVGLGVLLNEQAEKTEQQFGSALEITVFLCRDDDSNNACTGAATDAQKDAILTVLEDSPEVESVRFESQAEAFDRAEDMLGPEQFEGPDAIITEKDMAESYWVTLTDPREADVVTEQVQGLDGVSYVQDLHEITGPLLASIDELTWFSIGVAVFLVIAALLLVGNTVRLAAFARRKEIGIMRLVGASTAYIALPFLLEALVTAVLGVLLAIGALAVFLEFEVIGRLSDRVDFLPWVDWSDFGSVVLIVAVVGPIITVLPTLLLTRKYLKV